MVDRDLLRRKLTELAEYVGQLSEYHDLREASSRLYPVRDGPGQKLLDRDAVAADEQRAVRLEESLERSNARMCLRRAAALDFDGRQAPTCAHNEVDLGATVTPIVEGALAGRGRVRQVRAHGGLDESAPPLRIAAGFGEREAARRRHERRVEHLELRA